MIKVLFTHLLLLCLFCINPLEAAWSKPVTISSPISSVPEVSIDAFGNGVAIWKEFDGAFTNVQAATFVKGKHWKKPTTLSSVLGNNDQANPQVSINTLGYAVAVWEEFDGTNSIVRSSTLPFGGTWSPPVTISAPTFDSSQIPQVAVDPMGNAVAVWQRHNGSFNITQAATLPFEGTWSTPVDISLTTIDTFSPQVGVDNFGNAIAVWTNVTNQIIQGATLPFGGAWTAPVNISSSSDLSNVPDLAVNPAGNGVAVWTALSSGNFFTQASTFTPGGGWTAPTDISSIGVTSFEVEAAIDNFGNAVAVWSVSSIGTDIFIQSAYLPFGSIWSAPVTLSSSGGQAFDAHVGFDALGNATAVWDFNDGVQVLIQSSMLPFGGSWTTPQNISSAGQVSDSPQISIDPLGFALVVWVNETFSSIQSASWTPHP